MKMFKFLVAIVFSAVCVFSRPDVVSRREVPGRYDVIRNFCEIKLTDPVDVDILDCLSYSKLVMEDGFLTEIYKVEYKNSTLYVYLSSSVLRSELSYGTQKIISLLNNEIGEKTISKIVFS